MQRKEYVIRLLETIKEDRPLAKGLLLLIQGGDITDATITALSKIFIDAVNKVHTKINEERVRKGADILKKIQTMEDNESDEELRDLESMLDNL